jgi:GTPase SAR1 family protein
VALGKIQGFAARIQLFTTPGQVFYNATRKLVLKGVDGIVFVADSQKPMRGANQESLKNLQENLAEYNLGLERIPLVLQYNKRDLPNLLSQKELEKDLNARGSPFILASAVSGQGIQETFDRIVNLTVKNLKGLEGTSAQPVNTSPCPTPSPAETKSSPTDLQIRECLMPQVKVNGSLEIPLILYSPSLDHEFKMTLQITLKGDSVQATPVLEIPSK